MKFYNQTNQQPNKTKQTENNMKTNARILLLGVITACLFILGVARAQTTIYWSENWENPADQNNWGNLYATWQIGVPTYGPPINSLGWRAHQGTNCAATILKGNYTDDRQDMLIYSGPTSQGILVPAANLNPRLDRKSTRLSSSHLGISYAVF